MSYLSLKNVSYKYPNGFLAVDNINIDLDIGDNVAIVGQNGAGKTTTVKMINGLLRPSSGDVIIGEKNNKEYTTAQISHRVGYVFQNPDDQIFHATVGEEIAYSPLKNKLEMSEVERLTNDALKLTELTKWKEENPFNLPYATRKFVTIASVIAMDCEILIFDEPTAGQDTAGIKRLSNLIAELINRGKTVITITHDMDFVANNFSKVIVMADKKVVTAGTPEEIFWDFDALRLAHLSQPGVSRICSRIGLNNKGIIKMDDAINGIQQLKDAEAGGNI